MTTYRCYEIKIEQIDGMGNVFRTFYHHRETPDQVKSLLRDIERGYNLDHTRVTVDGLDYIAWWLNNGLMSASV